MSAFTMTYDKKREEYNISRVPDVVFDLIIETLMKHNEVSWIGEELSDEQAAALAEAGVTVND